MASSVRTDAGQRRRAGAPRIARPVFVTGDDFTVRGGANDGGMREKFSSPETPARRWRMPVVRLVDGTGGGGSVKHLETLGRTLVPESPGFTEVLLSLSEIPVVALGLGSVAGMGAARVWQPLLDHGARLPQLFAAGPPVVARTARRPRRSWAARTSTQERNHRRRDGHARRKRSRGRAGS